MKFNIYGQLFGTNGYSNHTKGLCNALYKLTPDINLDVPGVPGWELQCNDQELSMINNGHQKDGHNIMIGLPPSWPQAQVEPGKSFNGFLIWEGDKIPQTFISHIWKADKILVPSNHVKEAILKTVKEIAKLDKPIEGWEVTDLDMESIKIVHHGVDTKLFIPQEKKKDQPFIFCCNSGWAQGLNDRKGVQYLIKAFAEEFNKKEKVELRLKINPAYITPGWNLQAELDKLELPKDRPPMLISTNAVDYKALPKFYAGDCYVSPTMGDAFNIPCAEAMSCALPCITTNFGGQTDFVNKDNGWLIDYKLQEVNHDWMYEGISWALPDMKHLKKLMRHAFEHPEECHKKGLLARETIEEGFTWDMSAKKLMEVLEDDEKD